MAKLDMAETSAESESAITTADADTEGSQPSEVATGCFEGCDTHSPLFQTVVPVHSGTCCVVLHVCQTVLYRSAEWFSTLWEF